jgi:hypothetical protein
MPKPKKRDLLNEYLARRRPARIGEAEWLELREELAPVSDSYLRRLLRDSGVALDPVVEGVRQDSFQDLERTLLALQREYMLAVESGLKERAVRCRRAVIEAKDHARLAARRAGVSPERRAVKEEMAAWMLLWLENPEIFPAWLALRKKAGPVPAPTPGPPAGGG